MTRSGRVWKLISGSTERRLHSEIAALRLRLDGQSLADVPIASLRAELDQLRAEIDAARQARRREDAEWCGSTARAEARLSVRLAGLEMAAAAGVGEIREQARRIDDLGAQHYWLAAELPKFVQPVAEARAEAVMLGNRFGVISEDFAKLVSAIERLKAGQVEYSKAETQVTACIDALGALTTKCMEIQQSLGAIEGRLATADEHTERQDVALEDARSDLDHLRGALANERAERITLADNLAPHSSTEDVLRLVSDLRPRMADLGALVEVDFGSAISAVRAEFAELPPLVAELSAAANELRADRGRMDGELEQLRVQLRNYEAGVAALDQQRRALEGAIGDTRRLIGADDPSRLFVAAVNDGVMLLKRGDFVSESVAQSGAWDGHILEVMDAVASSRGGTALDVGTHFGTLMLAMSRRFPKVVCFEPNDFSFRMAQANIALNGLRNVELCNFPLYSSSVELSLGTQATQEIALPTRSDGAFDPLMTPNIAAYMFTEQGGRDYRHLSKTIDSLSLEDVSFIKIDVQGADGEVIMGAQEVIARCRPVIVFEWEQHLSNAFSVSLNDIREMLKRHGYLIQRLKEHNDKQIDYVAYPAVNLSEQRG